MSPKNQRETERKKTKSKFRMKIPAETSKGLAMRNTRTRGGRTPKIRATAQHSQKNKKKVTLGCS